MKNLRMKVTEEQGDGGADLVTVKHALAEVHVYEHTTAEGRTVIVVEVDTPDGDTDAVRVRINDAPIVN